MPTRSAVRRRRQAGRPARLAGLALVGLTVVGCALGPVGPSPTPADPSSGAPSPATTPGPSPTTPAPTPTSGPPSPSATPTLRPTPTVTPTPTPTPTPTARPTPTLRPTPTVRPTAPPTPAPTPRITPRPTPTIAPASLLVRNGPRTMPAVALTFDMGGRIGDAIAIVDWLIAHRVHASIFMTGAMADHATTDAGRDVLARIQAHPDLFTLGNHSYTHRDFRTLTAAEIRDELRRTEEALARSCSQDPHPFVRPPNGGVDGDVLRDIGAAGYRLTVTWDVDTIDWRPIVNDPPGPTADDIVAKVVGRSQNGSIVLMHLGGYETLAALPRVVSGLEGRGFDLVTLDELLGT